MTVVEPAVSNIVGVIVHSLVTSKVEPSLNVAVTIIPVLLKDSFIWYLALSGCAVTEISFKRTVYVSLLFPSELPA